jgi:hypothetical protein
MYSILGIRIFYYKGSQRLSRSITKVKPIAMNTEEIFKKVLDCSFRIHTTLGPGLLESAFVVKKNHSSEDIISVIMVVIRASAFSASFCTDSWVVYSILPSIPRSVIMLTAKHGRFI